METSTDAVRNLLLPVIITEAIHYDADDRGPSEISRELRCPDK
jgi:hypothetical protein